MTGGGLTAPAPAPRGAPIGQAGEIRSARVASLRGVAALAVMVGHIFGNVHSFNPATTIVDYLGRHVATASFPKLFVVAAPLCLAVALASYAVIEAPFLRLRLRWAPASAPQAPPGDAAPTPAS